MTYQHSLVCSIPGKLLGTQSSSLSKICLLHRELKPRPCIHSCDQTRSPTAPWEVVWPFVGEGEEATQEGCTGFLPFRSDIRKQSRC